MNPPHRRPGPVERRRSGRRSARAGGCRVQTPLDLGQTPTPSRTSRSSPAAPGLHRPPDDGRAGRRGRRHVPPRHDREGQAVRRRPASPTTGSSTWTAGTARLPRPDPARRRPRGHAYPTHLTLGPADRVAPLAAPGHPSPSPTCCRDPVSIRQPRPAGGLAPADAPSLRRWTETDWLRSADARDARVLLTPNGGSTAPRAQPRSLGYLAALCRVAWDRLPAVSRATTEFAEAARRRGRPDPGTKEHARRSRRSHPDRRRRRRPGRSARRRGRPVRPLPDGPPALARRRLVRAVLAGVLPAVGRPAAVPVGPRGVPPGRPGPRRVRQPVPAPVASTRRGGPDHRVRLAREMYERATSPRCRSSPTPSKTPGATTPTSSPTAGTGSARPRVLGRGPGAGTRLAREITNPKHQIPTEPRPAFGWDLVLGIWDLLPDAIQVRVRPQVDPPAADRRGRLELAGQLVPRHHVELRLRLEHRRLPLLRHGVHLPPGRHRRRRVAPRHPLRPRRLAGRRVQAHRDPLLGHVKQAPVDVAPGSAASARPAAAATPVAGRSPGRRRPTPTPAASASASPAWRTASSRRSPPTAPAPRPRSAPTTADPRSPGRTPAARPRRC